MAVSSTPTELDLAFIIDATGSMGVYIKSAQDNMRNIIQDIIISERCSLNVALILYRDHPPQENTFVIQVNDLTNDAEQVKTNIDAAVAFGGGDGPEATAPALHAAVHTLSWRKNAVKIAVLIADAPPHGLEPDGDHWPDGDPSGHDPIECVGLLAERGITLYTIGCEPAAISYRNFFMALAFKTGGQYIPLADCANLALVIVGSAKEEISLERLIAQVHEEVMREAALRGGPVDEVELTRRIHEVMQNGDVKVRRVKMENQDGRISIPALTYDAEQLSTLTTLKEVREKWMSYKGIVSVSTMTTTTTTFGGFVGLGKPKGFPAVLFKKRRTGPIRNKKTGGKVKTTIKKKARRGFVRGHRQSARLALNTRNNAEEEDVLIDNEAMEISTPSAVKPLKMKIEVSNTDLADEELLDINQTRRLVRKCVARNKLKST